MTLLLCHVGLFFRDLDSLFGSYRLWCPLLFRVHIVHVDILRDICVAYFVSPSLLLNWLTTRLNSAFFVFHFSRPVCRCFCSRQSERFHRARRDLVNTATKMHVDWFITLVVSSRLRKPRSAKSYFYQKATFSLVLIVSWRWFLVSFCHFCSTFWGFSLWV